MTSTYRRARTRSLALALSLASAVAGAQGRDDDPRRRQLILQAGTLRDRGDHEGALDLARQAAARRMSPSLRLFIAQEEQSLGSTLEALRDARLCAAEFEADPSLAHRDEFLASCRGIVTALSSRVARLTVQVPLDVPDLAVLFDDDPLPRDAWNTAREVLPGPHTLAARAPGRALFARTLNLPGGAAITVPIALTAATTSDPSPPTPIAPPPHTDPSHSPMPWVLAGVAGAAFVTGGVLYALRNDALAQRDGYCAEPSGDCVVSSPYAASLADAAQQRASTYSTGAGISLVVGALSLAGGVVWWIVDRASPSPAPSPSSRALSWRVTPSATGLSVGLDGHF